MTQTASDRFGEAPEYFPVVPLQCPYLTFTNSDFSMSLNSSSVLTLLAQTAPLQAGELPAQGNLGIKSTRCLPQRFPRAGFPWEALPWRGGESTNIHTSCVGGWATPSARTHLHQPHFGQRRRFALCGLSLPSHLSSSFTHHHRGLQFVRQRCHRWLCPSHMNSVSLRPHSSPIHPCCELPGLQPGSGCASTRSTLDPSFWQCHRLRSNYSSHELDPVHALKLPQLTAEVQTVTQ